MTQPTRACVDCHADISHRHGNARHCEPCAETKQPLPSRKAASPRSARSAACIVCGGTFATQSHKKITCSTACRMWARHHPGEPRPQDPRCAFCGAQVNKRARTTYCSKRCRAAASKRRTGRTSAEFIIRSECGHCGTPLGESRAGKKYCSAACEIREYGHPGSYTHRANRRCEYCGTPLDPSERINRRHCSDRCTVQANQVIRRARRKKLPAERFPRHEIFERDGWICHLCSGGVDPTLGEKHPFSASLDHLIPLSHPESPGHVRANVALAHLRCNLSKCGRARSEDWETYRTLLKQYEEATWPPKSQARPQPQQRNVS